MSARTVVLLAWLVGSGAPVLAQQQEHAHAHEPAQDDSSERAHVPPAAPATELPAMSTRDMQRMMAMDDGAVHFSVLLDELEARDTQSGSSFDWNVAAWLGGDFDKLWLSSEGAQRDGVGPVRSELSWDHAIGRWWSSQLGWRHDSGEGPARDWLAFGVRGLAPQFVEVQAMAYVGEQGAAMRIAARYELLFTQRLIAESELELDAYGQGDAARGIGSGLSSLQLGLRLRYEFRRGFAPYLGVAWVQLLGNTADLTQANGESSGDLQSLAGLRLRF